MISFQLIGPMINRYGNHPNPEALQLAHRIIPLQRLLPPGLAAAAIASVKRGDFKIGITALGLLCGYGVGIFWLLAIRLRAQFHGENLSEASIAVNSSRLQKVERLGWNLPGIPGAIAAIFEKEIRYLSRSGPMIFTLIMPVFILFIFRLTPSTSGKTSGTLLGRSSDLAFPVGAAYALLILTNLVYNSLGADGGGIQLFFTAPVRFRSVMAAKNMAHSGILALETILVWMGASLMFQPPAAAITLATVAGLSFALPVNLAAGNLLSISTPKKVDYGTFGRQRASNTTVFASFGVQIVVLGLAALTLMVARAYGRIWLATVIFLALAVIAWFGFFLALNSTDRKALNRREEIIAELTRAS